MQTSEHSFENIMSAVLEQKQVWEKLQAENRELRQQLIDLRAGRGIFVEIHNQRFELVWESTKTNDEVAEQPVARRSSAKPARAVQNTQPASSGVLEEMLLDEFSSAMSKRPAQEGKPANSTSLNEEQKATLRRELSGSFLLE